MRYDTYIMRRPLLLSLTTFFSVLGIADSVYLTDHALSGTALFCGTDGPLSGCNEVAQSVYSHFLGAPLASYGLAFYAAVLALAVIARSRPSRHVFRLLLLAGTLGLALSLYFIGLQVFVIQALCVYCIASFAFAAGIFVSTLLLARSHSTPVPEPLPPVL